MLHHSMTQPLLAADFTQVAIALVVIFFTAMKALFEMNKPAAPKRGPVIPPKPLQDPRLQVPKAQQAGGQQADQLRSQVEEFLRRAGKMPPQPNQPQAPQQRPVTEIELLVGDEPQRPQQRTTPDAARPAAPLPSASARRSGKRTKRRQSVAEHVAESVTGHVAQSVTARSKSMIQNTSRLGQRIVAEDQEFDDKLKAKFDHTLGTLSERSIEPTAVSHPPAVPSPAAEIAALLADPAGVRQAIVLNEILRRPSERW